MHKVFNDLKRAGILRYYLDDMIISASEWNELLPKLRLIFNALRRVKLTLNPTKCAFGKSTINFLGFQISAGTVSPGKKVDAILRFPQPMDVHGIRKFLGLTGFFRRFIPRYAQIAEPLTRLTKKSELFLWTAEQEQTFRELKDTLTSKPVLSLYDPDSAITEVHTDAYSKGIATRLYRQDLTLSLLC